MPESSRKKLKDSVIGRWPGFRLVVRERANTDGRGSHVASIVLLLSRRLVLYRYGHDTLSAEHRVLEAFETSGWAR